MPFTTTSAIRVAISAALGSGQKYTSIAGKTGIHRKTLSELDAGKDVELRLSQIEALHDYLSHLGLPILLQPKVVVALNVSDEVHVLIPAYRDTSDDHRRLCSPWDVLAADRIRTPLEMGNLSGRTVLQKVANDDVWTAPARTAPASISRVCIGSSRATCLFDTFAGRLMMFGNAKQFNTINLPFRFYWRGYKSRSPYVINEAEVSSRIRNQPRFKLARAAFIFSDGREPLFEISNLDDPALREFESYAVVLTRWVSERSVWACVSGLTGPATEAAARLFHNLDFAVPRPKNEEDIANTPLAVQFIKVAMTVPSEQNTPDDLRTLKEESIAQLGGTQYLLPPTPARRGSKTASR